MESQKLVLDKLKEAKRSSTATIEKKLDAILVALILAFEKGRL